MALLKSDRIRKLKKEREKWKALEREKYEKLLTDRQKKGTRIVEVKMILERPCYDTRWLITFEGLQGIDKITVVRHDTETLYGICNALAALHEYSRESLSSIDERDKIYYD